MSDIDVKSANHVGRFSIWLRKIKHTLIPDEPHYALLLTWPEIQALIDVTDSLPESDNKEFDVDFNKLCSKMSEQFKWHATTRSDTP